MFAVAASPAERISFETAQIEQRDPRAMFVNKDGSLSDHVIKLLRLDSLYEEGDTLATAVAKTQSAWIGVNQGQGNKERTDLVDSEERRKIKDEVVQCAEAMGLFAKRPPALRRYTYGVCHGAFLDGVRQNLTQLIVAWNQGVHFEKLIFLTGERTLRNEPGKEDDLEKLCSNKRYPLCKNGWTKPADAPYETEYDMVRLVWDQTELPKDMADALTTDPAESEEKVIFVNAPRGNNPRPGTKDTVQTLLKRQYLRPGTMLACSYPLLWSYQHLAVEPMLRKRGITLDTSAPEATPPILARYEKGLVSIIFDTVAKCLYEIKASN